MRELRRLWTTGKSWRSSKCKRLKELKAWDLKTLKIKGKSSQVHSRRRWLSLKLNLKLEDTISRFRWTRSSLCYRSRSTSMWLTLRGIKDLWGTLQSRKERLLKSYAEIKRRHARQWDSSRARKQVSKRLPVIRLQLSVLVRPQQAPHPWHSPRALQSMFYCLDSKSRQAWSGLLSTTQSAQRVQAQTPTCQSLSSIW